MWHQIGLSLILLCSTPLLLAEDTVLRSARAIHDGNLYADAVHVDFGDEEHPSKVLGMLRLMPRLKTLVMGGPRFHKDDLPMLVKLTSLQVLVLDSVDISAKAMAEFQQTRPDLLVIRSQRRAIEAIQRISPEILIETKLSEKHPEVRQLLGDRYFYEATEVNFRRLPDDESGPFDRILNEELASLRMLPTLTRLDLSWTRLNDGGMYYLKPLTQVEWLSIPTDEVSADGLIYLQGMTRLKILEAGPIDDAGMRRLTGLRALETFSIGPNSEATDAGLESLGQLPRLKSLSLKAPRIEGTGLRHLARLPGLEGLELGTGVRDITALPDFPALRGLSLVGADVNDDSLAPLAKCHLLETLTLDKTPATDKSVVLLGSLSHLQYLSLQDTQVGDEGLAALSQIPGLRGLYLARTRITNVGLAALRKYPALEQLTLYGMPLDEVGIQHLLAMRKLKELSVTYPHDFYPDLQQSNAAHRVLRERLKAILTQ